MTNIKIEDYKYDFDLEASNILKECLIKILSTPEEVSIPNNYSNLQPVLKMYIPTNVNQK